VIGIAEIAEIADIARHRRDRKAERFCVVLMRVKADAEKLCAKAPFSNL